MNEPQSPKPCPGGFGARVLLLSVPAAAFTLLIVQYSLHRGKLVLPPTYDDVSYMKDGLWRLDAFYTGGVRALLGQYLQKPPHTPLSALLALAGYALFGIHDWAPYAANFVIVLALLAFVDYLTRGMSRGSRIVLLLYALTVPVVAQSVYEFRPDMGAGLLTAIALVLLLEQSFILATRHRRVLVGLIAALALLAKPSVFPVTLGLLGVTLLAVTARDVYVHRRSARARDYVKAWLQVLLPAILLPLPHYIVNRHEIWGYLATNVFGSNRAIWEYKGDFAAHTLFFATGLGGNFMLGRHLVILGLILLAGIAVAFRRRDKRWLAMACAYLIVLAVAYIGPTSNPIKTEFLATPFAFLLLFAALMTFRYFASLPGDRLLCPLCRVLPVVVLCLGVGWFRWPSYAVAALGERAAARNQCVSDIYQGLRTHAGPGHAGVLMAVIGPLVNDDVLQYMQMKDGASRFDLFGDPTNSDLGRFNELVDRADFVVIGDPNNSDDPQGFACNMLLPRTLPMVRARPDFRLIATAPNGSGKNYYVFERLEKAPPATQPNVRASREGGSR